MIMSQQIDGSRYKAGQRQEWNNAAEGWRRWWETIEKGLQHGSDRMVELARIKPGHHVLDIATGIGEPAVTAARRVGSGGAVLGIDQAPEMLAVAGERAAALGLQNLEFREMDAELLDLPTASFDAALCHFALMFLPDLESALNRIRRVLVSGGAFVAVIPGAPAKVPFMSLPMGVIQRMIDLPPPPAGMPHLFRFSDVGQLEQSFLDAGFAEVTTERGALDLEFSSGDAYVQFVRDVVAEVSRLVSGQSPERQDEVWRSIADAAAQYATPDGRVRFPNEMVYIVGAI